jgi:hypothetical protein
VATPAILIGQDLADRCALIAQKYAGWFYGRETRAGQHGTRESGRVFVSDKPWVEPFVMADGCDFCKVTTDERVAERIRGYQAAIDIEVLRGKGWHYQAWVQANGLQTTPETKRRFIEENEDLPREDRPAGWRRTALNLTKLPHYLKRRLCVEWNHALRDWLAEHPFLEYDFDAHEIRPRVSEEDLTLREIRSVSPERADAMEQDLADDHAYAASVPVLEELSLESMQALEYEGGLW